MPYYRRLKSSNPQSMYFLTVVTKDRRPFLKDINVRRELWKNLNLCAIDYEGKLFAYVFLDDHFHIIIEQGQKSFSNWIGRSKRKLNQLFPSEKTIWQKRFWESKIRSCEDLKFISDYIHYNPVKHGYVTSPKDYKPSSFLQFVKDDLYDLEWSSNDEYFFDDDRFVEYGGFVETAFPPRLLINRRNHNVGIMILFV